LKLSSSEDPVKSYKAVTIFLLPCRDCGFNIFPEVRDAKLDDDPILGEPSLEFVPDPVAMDASLVIERNDEGDFPMAPNSPG
jgi:hypothetical protein